MTASQIITRSLRGVRWTAVESVAVAAVALGSFLLMARLLTPEDFGVVAIATSFVFLFNLVAGHTFADALVQSREVDRAHRDTAFWGTVAVAALLYLAAYFGADIIARVMHEPKVEPILKALAWLMPISALASVQTAMFRREMRFREVAVFSMAGRVAGALTGVGMALTGWGAWSLVGQQLGGALLTAAMTVAAARYLPGLRFSPSRFRALFGFGMHVSASQLVTGIAEQAMNLLVGAFYNAQTLGYFNLAWRTVQLTRMLFASAVYHVSFSAFSRLQDDRAALAKAFLQATQMSCLFGFPLGVGLAVVAEPLIVVLYGPRWEPSITLLQILAISMLPSFFIMFVTACYRAVARPAWVLYVALGDLVLSLAGIALLRDSAIWAIAAFWTLKMALLVPVHALLLRRLLDVKLWRIVGPVVAPLAASGVMAVAVIGISQGWDFGLPRPGSLAVQVAAGALCYALALLLLAPRLARRTLGVMRTLGA